MISGKNEQISLYVKFTFAIGLFVYETNLRIICFYLERIIFQTKISLYTLIKIILFNQTRLSSFGRRGLSFLADEFYLTRITNFYLTMIILFCPDYPPT